jgi:hypothetical protein
MNQLSFYKPNSYNKGSASQFQYGLKPGDDGLYVSIVKQSSWDDKTKRGSFSANAKDPTKNKKIKLNATEAGAIYRVLTTPTEKWSSVHRTTEKVTSLSFSHYIKEGNKLGYGFSIVSKGEDNFMLSLTNDEGVVLSIFLYEYIKSTFQKETVNF